MITEERLKELIKQGATIYSTGYREEVDLSLPCYIKDGYLVTDEGNGFEPTYLLENLTESLEETEWQAEFGCIEKTIRLELPMFDEFREPIRFTGQDNIKYWITKWQDYICILGNDNIFRLICDYTKENYIEACRKAKELFLGAER